MPALLGFARALCSGVPQVNRLLSEIFSCGSSFLQLGFKADVCSRIPFSLNEGPSITSSSRGKQ